MKNEYTDSMLLSSYYMPHTAVIRPDKGTSKAKNVFDASSKVKNSNLQWFVICWTQPQSSVVIIFKFSIYEIAFTSDIEKAFFEH